MTVHRWEYLALVHQYSVRQKDQRDPNSGYEWDDTYFIWFPSATEAEIRSTNWGASNLLLTEVLNELGSDMGHGQRRGPRE